MSREDVPRESPAAIAALADRSPVPADRLRRAARADDPAVRRAAVEALAEADPSGSESVLADAVLDPDREVRLAAIEAVGRSDVAAAASALATVLERESDPEVRSAAVRALGRIGGDDAVPPLLDALAAGPADRVREAIAGIGAISREGTARRVLDELERALDAGDAETARALATAARRVEGGPAIRAVRERQAESETLATHIAQLAHYERVVDEHGLVSPTAFESPDPFLRRDAADEAGRVLVSPADGESTVDVALGEDPIAPDAEMDADEIVDALLESLEDDDLDVRAEAALSLLAVRDRRAVGPLCRTLDGALADDPDAARSILYGLVLLWPGRTVELLVHHAKTSDDGVGAALGVLRWRLCERASLPAPSQAVQLWFAGRDARSTLAEAEPGERDPEAVAALAVTGSTRDVPLLCSCLEDPDELVRAQAAFALGHLGCSLQRLSIQSAAVRAEFTIDDIGGARDERVPPALLDALADETEPVVLARLADALGMYGASEAVEPLCSLLSRPEPLLRETAVAALGRIGDERAIDPPRDRLRSDDDELVRAAAAAALGAIGDDRAVDALDTALQSDPAERVRTSAAGALGRVDGTAADRALSEAAVVDEAPDVRRAARIGGGWTPFRGTRFEGPARSIWRSTIAGFGTVAFLAWRVGGSLRRVLGFCWRLLRPAGTYVVNALLGWLIIFVAVVLLALLVMAVGAILP